MWMKKPRDSFARLMELEASAKRPGWQYVSRNTFARACAVLGATFLQSARPAR
jgi:hypothetical protein